MSSDEKYGGQLGAHQDVYPGDPRYISVEEATRLELARRAAYEARPEVRAKRKADAEVVAQQKAKRAADEASVNRLTSLVNRLTK